MSDPIIVRLSLDTGDRRAFADYWREMTKNEPAAKTVSIISEPPAKPKTGLGSALPPDLLLNIPPEMLKHFAEGIAGALGTGLGTWLWKKITDFLNSRQPQTSGSKKIVISVGKERTTIRLEQLSKEPPEILKRLDKRR